MLLSGGSTGAEAHGISRRKRPTPADVTDNSRPTAVIEACKIRGESEDAPQSLPKVAFHAALVLNSNLPRCRQLYSPDH